ncbi:Pkinase-domain-containing protein [Peniophora sp. CONT]|nr:Pkinase-domain-containing protein [Peniophora sp. CONT]
MPPGVAVVDAFKNLIRHGKAHTHASPRSDELSSPPPSASSNSRSRGYQQEQQQPMQQAAVPEKRTSSQQTATPTQTSSTAQHKYSKEVEQIVAEERDAKTKLPRYKGLERFELLEKMGDGAFSNVFKAVDTVTGQKVAVKVVRKFELTSSQAGDKHLNPNFKKRPRVTERANILKEVQIMRGIQHPGIVKLLSFSESPEYYFLVLELMGGGELFHQIVKLTYFSEALSRHVIVQVAQGIRYLHEERGVVHRDIKPENLLFDRIPIIPSKNPIQRQYDEEKEDEGEFIPGVGGGGIGRVKIADFGLSKVVWNEETMTPCGTVGYTAPEIVKDERYSKSVDMWAMGCVLYTLLCGFPPFYDESINVLTEKVARGHYTFLSPWWDDINPSAKDLITHLLCVDPAERYTIDEFLAHPWIRDQAGPPPPPTPRFEQPLDSPLLQSMRAGGREGRSPGLATLKEAFDVTYAVHRMEEEGARRRAYKGRDGAGKAGFLADLNEDDEDDETRNVPVAAQSSIRQRQERMSDGRAGQRDQGKTRNRNGKFELTMDGATLLDRRHKRGGNFSNNPANPSPLANSLTVDAPQSPMHF